MAISGAGAGAVGAIAGIDSARIEAMVNQLRNVAAKAQAGGVDALARGNEASGVGATGRVFFADVLKTSLDQVNASQKKAEALGQRFALGDDSVNLSDVMISSQKASIAFQATIQVRNKLVSAYHDMMNMQV